MPKIQIIQNRRSALGNLPSPHATGDAFGAQVGRALQNLGGALSDLGAAAASRQRQKEEVETRLIQAEASQTWTRQLIDRESNATGDAAGHTDSVIEDFDAFAQSKIDAAKSDSQRESLKLKMASLKTSVVSQSAKFEARKGVSYERQAIQGVIDEATNLVSLDPSSENYSRLVSDTTAVIDSLEHLPSDLRTQLKDKFVSNAAASRFQSLIDSAGSTQEVELVLSELGKGDWAKLISPSQFSTLQNKASTRSNTLQRTAVATANATYDAISGRMKDGVKIPPAELAAAERLIVGTGDQKLISKYGVARTKYDAQMAALGAAPSAIDDAISNLGDQAKRFKFGALQVDANTFKSKHYSWKDLRNHRFADARIDSGAVAALDAVTDAFGKKLTITSSARSGKYNGKVSFSGSKSRHVYDAGHRSDAFDISIAGMSEAERTRLVTLFVEAGANGLGSYDNGSIHVDFRPGGRGKGPGGLALWHHKQSYSTHSPAWFKAGVEGGLAARASGENGFTRLEHAQAEGLENARKQIANGVKKDPIAFAESNGVVPPTNVFDETGGLSPSGLQNRLIQANTVADFYGDELIPQTVLFSNDELMNINDTLQTAEPEQKLEFARTIVDALGADADIAFAQISKSALGADSDMFSFIGGLVAQSDRNAAVASQILKGQHVMNEDPQRGKSLGTSREMFEAAGSMPADSVYSAVSDRPALQVQLREAALAHYVATNPTASDFDAKKYQASLKAVSGDSEVYVMNGRGVMLPQGVSAKQFDDALEALETSDLASYSVGGGFPVDAFGDLIPARDVTDYGYFQNAGKDSFFLMFADGPAIDAETHEPYAILLDEVAVGNLSGRALAARENRVQNEYDSATEEFDQLQKLMGVGQ